MKHKLPINAKPQKASAILEVLETRSDALYEYLGGDVYVNHNRKYLDAQIDRFIAAVKAHIEKFGDEDVRLLRAPGRLNAFLEYLDMCRGDHMSTTIDGDIPMVFAPRKDGFIHVQNSNPLFNDDVIDIRAEFDKLANASWAGYEGKMEDNWDNRTLIYPHQGRPQGSWLNYLISSYLRMLWDDRDLMLRGADMTFGEATAPFRAGTSSSSAIVVLGFLAMYLTNKDNLPALEVKDMCRLLGEAEWYVGTHGGANDQTTILRNPANCVSYNRHSRDDLESTPLPFLEGVNVVLANSLWEVNKSMGGNQSFNMRKGWMQMGDELLTMIINDVTESLAAGKFIGRPGEISAYVSEKYMFETEPTKLLDEHPEYWKEIKNNYRMFGSFCEDILKIPDKAITELIELLPVKIRPEEAARIFNSDILTVCRTYTEPRRKIGGYHIRTTARFFHRENQIGRELERMFLEAKRKLESGELESYSREYDAYRTKAGILVDELQDALSFTFRVSNAQLDLLLSIARRGPGYLGGKLTGAGKGGCVSILVREEYSQAMCDYLDKEYYHKEERFDMYRQVLKDDAKFCDPGSPEAVSAVERMEVLENALKNIPAQRRVITFSSGACTLDLVGK
ncbi:MAG: hypothetical protein J6U98_03695 [Abditibacteriota bacterium]|nr:hypothetical protein [Abditibacteriota bacterium]